MMPAMLPLPDDATQKIEPPAGPPARFGAFRVLSELGRGGMGVVYRAVQEPLGRDVALKVLPVSPTCSSASVERFFREASLVAKLQHEGIVQVYAMGQEPSCLFYAMELVEGTSLRERLRGIAMVPRESARIARDVARALAHAHARGVIHRDIKPANIVLDAQERPRLVDFGIARGADSEALTVSGQILGTPAYMSPEQASGSSRLDARTDVYSLGAVLYEMLAGQPPVAPTEDVFQQIYAVMTFDPTPPSRLNPRTPRDLEVIVARAMEKEVSRRYPTAEALADDLDRHLGGEAILARPPTAARRALQMLRRHRGVSACTAVLVLLTLGGLVYALTRPAHLTLDVRPPDARVFIDGASQAVSAEAVRDLSLPAGRHRFRVERKGYAAVDLPYTLERMTRVTVPLNLERVRSPVDVLTYPEECRVVFRGLEGETIRHLSPIVREPIETDTYEVTVERSRYYRRRFPLVVAPGRAASARVWMPPSVLWETRESQYSTIVMVPGDDMVAAVCADDGLCELRRARDGALLGRASAGGRFAHPIAVDVEPDGVAELLVVSKEGRIQLLQVPGGTPRWSVDCDDRDVVYWPPCGILPSEVWLNGPEKTTVLDAKSGAERATRPSPGRGFPMAIDVEDPGDRSYILHGPGTLTVLRWPSEVAGRTDTPPFQVRAGTLSAIDLDGDKRREFLCIYTDGTLRAWRLQPLAQIWVAELGQIERTSFAVGSLQGAEPPSVVCLSAGDRLKVLDASGSLRWERGLPAPPCSRCLLADMDADGRRDLVYASADAVWVLDLFSDRVIGEVPAESRPHTHPVIADVDEDGLLDVVLSFQDGTVRAIPGQTTLWEARTKHSILRAPALGDLDGDGLPEVVCTSLDQGAHAFEGRTGRELWTVSLENQAATTPALLEGDVVISSWAGIALRVRGKDGSVLWTYRPREEGWAVRFHASPAAADGDAGPVVFLADWRERADGGSGEAGGIHGLDAMTGRLRWVRAHTRPFASAPVPVPGGRLLVADISGNLLCLDGSDGSVLWNAHVDESFEEEGTRVPADVPGAPAVVWPLPGNDRVAAVYLDEASPRVEVHAWGTHVAWASEGGRWIQAFTGPEEMGVRDWPGGQVLWKRPPGETVLAAPVVADFNGDGLMEVGVVDGFGTVSCLRAATGELLWARQTGTGSERTPVRAAPRVADLDGDGAPEIVVSGGDGRLVVLHGRGRRWSGSWPAPDGDLFGTGAPASVGPTGR